MSREPLHSDLASRRIHVADGIYIIHHPLVVDLAIIPEALNRKYRQKLYRLAQETDPEKIIWLYERPYRMTTLLGMWEEGLIDRQQLRRLLPQIWIDGEGNDDTDQEDYEDRQKIIHLFREMGFFSDNGWAAPTQPMPLWRGGSPHGMSWTLARRTAEFFTSRYPGRPRALYRAVAPPNAVLAVFMDARGESEVVVDPTMLQEAALEKGQQETTQ